MGEKNDMSQNEVKQYMQSAEPAASNRCIVSLDSEAVSMTGKHPILMRKFSGCGLSLAHYPALFVFVHRPKMFNPRG